MSDFKYPMLNNYLSFEQVDDKWAKVNDCLLDKTCTLSRSVVRFAKRLDGKTDPYSIPTEFSREEVGWTLSLLDNLGLLRRNNVLIKGFGTIYYTVWIPKITKRMRNFARIYSRFLDFLWLPVLLLGIGLFAYFLPFGDDDFYAAGFLLGVVFGVPLHELGHALSGIAYGAPVYEMGVSISHFLPGAYMLVDTDALRSRRKRIKVLSAGIKSNLLLAGICLLVACAFPAIWSLMYAAAIWNIVVALFNLLFESGLDGQSIISEYLGIKDIRDTSKKVIFDKESRKKHRKNGSTGYALIAVSAVFQVFRLSSAFFILCSVLTVVEYIFK